MVGELNTYGTETPLLTDYATGVDDPGGTWSVANFTFTAIRTLLQANFTTLTASTSLAIAGNATLTAPSANILELANSTTAQAFRVYNTYTDASNGEWGALWWDSDVLKLGAYENGTGSPRTLALYAEATGSAGDQGLIWISNASYIAMGNGNADDVNNALFAIQSMNAAHASIRSNRPHHMYKGMSIVLDGEKTISSGAVTITGGYHTIDTEADAASDDLDTITKSTENSDGHILIIRAANDARTVVAKDGTGNLALAGDCTLDNTHDTLTLIWDNAQSLWLELSRSDNGA